MHTLRLAIRIAIFLAVFPLLVPVSTLWADAGDQHGRVEITFRKWVLSASLTPTLMAGVTGGEVEGVFFGEVFENVPSKRVPSEVNRLEVIYGVEAGDRSFTSLLQGGQSKPGGVILGSTARLDGFVLAGWRRGAQVRVEWVLHQGSEDCPSPPAGAGASCFIGTITVERAPND